MLIICPRIKMQLRAEQIYARDSADSVGNRYGRALTSGLTVEDVRAWPDILQAVTEDDIIAAAQRVFDIDKSVTGWLMRPQNEAANDEVSPMIRVLMAAIVAFVALPAKAEIAIQEVISPAGTKAWLVEERSIPFVALNVWFRGGGTLDLPGKRGATNLMVGLLEEGTGEMSAQDFAREAEELAAEFDYEAI